MPALEHRRSEQGPSEHRPTLGETIAARLAEEIVTGSRKPGVSLDEVSLARDYGVSRTPVREALRQLASTGLLVMTPRRGAVVALPGPVRLNEMFQVMAELEAMAAALSAVSMTYDQRRELQSQHEAMASMVRTADVAGYRAGNVAFHHLLYAGANNGYLAEIATTTRRRLAPFRAAQLEAPDRLRRSHAEHGTIVTAIQRGDATAAADHLRAHIGVTEQTWMAMAAALRRPTAA